MLSLDEQKQLAAFDHRLQLKRIWIEKVLFALLIVLFTLSGNIIIEKYKRTEEISQFLLNGRLIALQDIRAKFSTLTHRMGHQVEHQVLTPLDRETYIQDIKDFRDSVNKSSLLFPHTFSDIADKHAWIHMHAARSGPLELKYQPFLDDLFQDFDVLSRRALFGETPDSKSSEKPVFFTFEAWDEKRLGREGLKKFWDSTYNQWAASPQASSPNQSAHGVGN